jgi:hypothetical protein
VSFNALHVTTRLTQVHGELSAAFQVIRAMKLLEVPMDTERYKSWVLQVQEKQVRSSGQIKAANYRGRDGDEVSSNRDGGGGGGGGGVMSVALERLKWFLGLPNNYYAP